MKPTASRPFENLCPFVFRHHTLHLQQQLIFWSRAQRPVHEHHFHAVPLQFLQQDHLVGVSTGQAVRCQQV
jgi:hypothetical protein